MTEPYGNKTFLHDQPAFRLGNSFIIVFSSTGTKQPSTHSNFQLPGIPLRTLSNSTCQRGKPTPGILSSNSLGKCVICHRATQVVVLILRRSFRNMKPVTLLFSTANCKRRD